MIKRRCKSCGTDKPITGFHKNSKGKYGKSNKCKQCAREYSRAYREDNNLKVLAKKFNTSEEEIQEALSIPFCQICGDKSKRLVIDHCHNTGKIRGRLCSVCNSAIGLLKDDIFLLKR